MNAPAITEPGLPPGHSGGRGQNPSRGDLDLKPPDRVIGFFVNPRKSARSGFLPAFGAAISG